MSGFGDLTVGDTFSTAFIPPDSSSSNAASVSKQLQLSGFDGTFNAAQLANAASQPVAPNPWRSEAASPSNAQPSAAPSTGPKWLPPGGTYDPKTDTWEHTQGAASNTLSHAPTRSATSGTRSAGATPSPIDPKSLPPGSLDKAKYDAVTERNRYLASKYDPNSLYDRFINSFTGAMSDPANVRTPSEQAEHEALSQKIIDTVFPQPTLAEARLNMMAASPIGTIASLATGAAGGSQHAQDLALIGGSTIDTFGLGRGMQPGGRPFVSAALRMRTAGQEALRNMGLGDVALAGKSFNSGRKALERAGFEWQETTDTGRQVFRNAKTGARVYYDSGDALVGSQRPHWHIQDAGGKRYDRTGRVVGSGENAGHIPAAR